MAANFLVWSVDNNTIWDVLTFIFLMVMAKPLWLVSNNNRNALFIVTSKAYGELASLSLILVTDFLPAATEFAFPTVLKYCHTVVYLHTFALALNRAHIALASLHYFEKVNKIFILRICAFCNVIPLLICYPSALYPQIWKYFIDAGLWMSFAIYAFITGKFIFLKWRKKYEAVTEKDHAKIFASCLCMLLPLMCSHYTSVPLLNLLSSDSNADDGDKVTLNQILIFLLNIMNNCSTIGDEFCLLILCQELRHRTMDQFRFITKRIKFWPNRVKTNPNTTVNVIHQNDGRRTARMLEIQRINAQYMTKSTVMQMPTQTQPHQLFGK